jgi:hypothetical protein
MHTILTRISFALSNVSLSQLKSQILHSWLATLIGTLAAALILTGIFALSRISGTSLSKFTRDPVAINDAPFYYGLLSNLGIMTWTVTVAICFFAGFLLAGQPRYRNSALFLLSSGFISLMLVMDDAFLFHEQIIPKYLHLPEITMYLLYMVVISLYLVYFLHHILLTDYLLLFLAFLILGSSLLTDLLISFSRMNTVLEDWLKFYGIVLWLVYFARTAVQATSSAFIDSREAIRPRGSLRAEHVWFAHQTRRTCRCPAPSATGRPRAAERETLLSWARTWLARSIMEHWPLRVAALWLGPVAGPDGSCRIPLKRTKKSSEGVIKYGRAGR